MNHPEARQLRDAALGRGGDDLMRHVSGCGRCGREVRFVRLLADAYAQVEDPSRRIEDSPMPTALHGESSTGRRGEMTRCLFTSSSCLD